MCADLLRIRFSGNWKRQERSGGEGNHGRSEAVWIRAFEKNRSLNAKPSISRHRFLGLRQYAGDYNLVERQPFDFVDDSARNRQLVLCPVLRFLQIVANLPLTEGRTRPSQMCGTRCSTRRATVFVDWQEAEEHGQMFQECMSRFR